MFDWDQVKPRINQAATKENAEFYKTLPESQRSLWISQKLGIMETFYDFDLIAQTLDSRLKDLG